jgi:hypothetical protein
VMKSSAGLASLKKHERLLSLMTAWLRIVAYWLSQDTPASGKFRKSGIALRGRDKRHWWRTDWRIHRVRGRWRIRPALWGVFWYRWMNKRQGSRRQAQGPIRQSYLVTSW